MGVNAGEAGGLHGHELQEQHEGRMLETVQGAPSLGGMLVPGAGKIRSLCVNT